METLESYSYFDLLGSSLCLTCRFFEYDKKGTRCKVNNNFKLSPNTNTPCDMKYYQISDKYFEFEGTIDSSTHLERMGFITMEDRNEKHRLFEVLGRKYLDKMDNEYDIERHKRYEINKNTEIIVTVYEYTQTVHYWRWKVE